MQFNLLSAFLAWYLVVCAQCLKSTNPVVADRRRRHSLDGTYGGIDAQKYPLRICNAFTSMNLLDVTIGEEMITENSPIPYKSCREVELILRKDTHMDFDFGNGSSGVFKMTDLPKEKSLLLLVAYRNPQSNDDVIFHSHVFAKPPASHTQLLVVDAYSAKAKSEMTISRMQAVDELGTPALESLRYNEVVVIGGGKYRLRLHDNVPKTTQNSTDFVAKDGESYVAIRVGGAGGKLGELLPEELIVYPQSSSSSEGSQGSSQGSQGNEGSQGSQGSQGNQGSQGGAHSKATRSGSCLGLAFALVAAAVMNQV